MIERNRDKSVPIAGLNMFVEDLSQPSDQPSLLIVFISILEADDGIADLTFRAIAGPRPFEMPLFLHTIVTEKSRVVGFQAGIGITALPAKRRFNSHRFRRRGFVPGKSQIQGAFGPVPHAGSGEMEG